MASYALLLAGPACDDALGHPLERPSPGITATPPPSTEGVEPLARRLSYRRFEVTERLSRELARPDRFGERRCTIRDLDASSRTVVLGTEDARYEPKHLLPLDLLEQILGADFRFSGLASRFSPDPPAPTSKEEAARALAELEVLSKRRYKAVYYITDYGAPRLIRRKDRARSEWVPGVLAAWLVVHDLDEKIPLCQSRIIARNDIQDEPISRKLKHQVQKRLIRELGQALRSQTISALARLELAEAK
jgi:hypothetical protein